MAWARLRKIGSPPCWSLRSAQSENSEENKEKRLLLESKIGNNGKLKLNFIDYTICSAICKKLFPVDRTSSYLHSKLARYRVCGHVFFGGEGLFTLGREY